jgi:ATP-dependent Clp protease ATP-binding subunit ClpC
MRYRLRTLLNWLGWSQQATSVELSADRFTDRVQNALKSAGEESSRFNHEYIGPEHLMLALLRDGRGVAVHILQNLSGDVSRIQNEIEQLIIAGPKQANRFVVKPMTPRAKRILEYAQEEAQSLRHNYVGTEHLLLGILREPDCLPACVLISFGVSRDGVRQELLKTLGDA